MKRLATIAAALALTGCASAYPVGNTYTADLRENPPPAKPNPLFMVLAGFLIETDPNRTVTTVAVGRERYTVTTRTSRDGRRSSVTIR
jgi:hypothetical protein